MAEDFAQTFDRRLVAARQEGEGDVARGRLVADEGGRARSDRTRFVGAVEQDLALAAVLEAGRTDHFVVRGGHRQRHRAAGIATRHLYDGAIAVPAEHDFNRRARRAGLGGAEVELHVRAVRGDGDLVHARLLPGHDGKLREPEERRWRWYLGDVLTPVREVGQEPEHDAEHDHHGGERRGNQRGAARDPTGAPRHRSSPSCSPRPPATGAPRRRGSRPRPAGRPCAGARRP